MGEGELYRRKLTGDHPGIRLALAKNDEPSQGRGVLLGQMLTREDGVGVSKAFCQIVAMCPKKTSVLALNIIASSITHTHTPLPFTFE